MDLPYCENFLHGCPRCTLMFVYEAERAVVLEAIVMSERDLCVPRPKAERGYGYRLSILYVPQGSGSCTYYRT
jgi:hypothetical protein